MPIIAQLIADRMIMCPTRHRIETPGKIRRTIPYAKGELEVWTERVGAQDLDDVDVFVLKFHGTAGRAERSTYHPMDYWSDLRAELWAVNPPGYGGSSGSASVRTLGTMGEAAFAEIQRLADGRPIVIIGNSLGTVPALYVGARHPVAGMVLRNPPPLRHLIIGRYGWWNLWVGAWYVSRRVPASICSVTNAQQVTCPCIFITSCRDETVPMSYQEKIFQEYAGPFRLLRMKEADHATSLNLAEQREYSRHLEWLRMQTALPHATFSTVATAAN